MGRTVTNYIRLANTVGVIERDKNIYFVPHKIDLYSKALLIPNTSKVCTCYFELLKDVLSFSSKYNNIQISSWSPEDRILVIDGTIDDFRQSRGKGLALNYLLVAREVSDTEPSGSSSYYYAFFIDSVEQLGLNSVKLNVTPDFFTNFFYLNNEDYINKDYDPFNTVMKNCFIERQHYDRFYPMIAKNHFSGKKKDAWLVVDVTNVTGSYSGQITLASNSTMKVSIRDKITNNLITNLPTAKSVGQGVTYISIQRSDRGMVVSYNQNYVYTYSDSYTYLAINSSSTGYTDNGLVSFHYFLSINDIRYTNLERILSSEESFRYKYQYKDKYDILPIGFDISYSRLQQIYESLKAISNKSGFVSFMNSLSNTEKKIVCSIFTSYLNIIFKENLLFPVEVIDSTLTLNDTIAYYAGSCKYGDINSPLTQVVIPFISIPREFSNISKDWLYSKVRLSYKNTYLDLGKLGFKSATEPLTYLSSIGASQYILTNFISKYSPLFNSVSSISIDSDSKCAIEYTIGFEQDSATYGTTSSGASRFIDLNKNSFGFLPNIDNMGAVAMGERFYAGSSTPSSPIDIIHDSIFYYNSNNGLYKFSGKRFVTRTKDNEHAYYRDASTMMNYFVFVLGDNHFNQQVLEIPDDLSAYNPINQYKDPLIESEPYKFYSISIYETEQILYRNRYFKSYYPNDACFTIMLDAFISFNDCYKVGIVPEYLVDDEYKRYYTDSVVLSIASQLPMIEDSWLSYFAQNKAQMKNQYAVQQNNFESGLSQGIVSGLEGVATGTLYGFAKGGTMGAVAGASSGLIKAGANIINTKIQNKYQVANIELTQKAKMSDMGAKPDTVKLAGSDILYDMIQNDRGFHITHYTIDEVSYNSICKYLERYGYQVNLFDRINIYDRAGLNYVKINSFDFVEDNFVLSEEQMNSISSIFENGVTLLHDKDYLHNLGESGYHNIETALKEVI